MSACAPAQTDIINTPEPQPTVVPTIAVTTPEWFDMELTDAQTGETFTMNDYAGKVVLLETMAIWCPNCVVQANEVRNLHEVLGKSRRSDFSQLWMLTLTKMRLRLRNMPRAMALTGILLSHRFWLPVHLETCTLPNI